MLCERIPHMPATTPLEMYGAFVCLYVRTYVRTYTHTHTHTDAQMLFLFCRLCQAEISKKMLNYNKVVTALLEVRIILSCTPINIIVCTDTE